jgi:peptidoglycan-associated lipoprotein
MSILARALRVVVGCAVSGALAGSCAQGPASVAQGPVTTATNAPVGQGVNIQPGTEEDFVVNVGRRTFFREGSSELDDTARVTLDKQAAWLARYPSWKVKVQGFADDSSSANSNVALSQKRAEAVRTYLSSQGVTSDRMQAKGYGKDPERLIRDCTDTSCKAQNRRVVTNLQETMEM